MKVEFKDAEGKYYPLDLAFESFDDNHNDNNNDKLRLSSTDDSLLIGNISIRLVKSNDQNFHVTTVKKARSSSPREAERIAEMISFPVDQSDSILTLPIAFPITTETKFRNQQVRVQIEVPVGKEIYINDRANNLQSYSVRGNGNGFTFDWDNDNGYNYMWTSGSWYIMTDRGLERKDGQEDSSIDNRIENFQRKIKEMDGTVDSVSMKIENGDTTVDIKIRTNDLADVADDEEQTEAEEPKSWKGRRVLLTALDFIRINR
jgi:phage shock protein C